jgi:hypothetical protein
MPVLSTATGETGPLLEEVGAGMIIGEDAEPGAIWEQFLAFRQAIAELGKAAADCRIKLAERYTQAQRSKAYGEAFARAMRQTRNVPGGMVDELSL